MHIAQDIQAQASDLIAQSKVDGIDQLATGAAVAKEGKLLLVTRADDEDVFPKYAEIPGGSVDPGEDLLQAVSRELQEEAGLKAKSIEKYLGSFDFVLKDGRKVRQFNYLIVPESFDVTLNPVEHSAYVWMDPTDTAYLDTILISELMKECVSGICKHLSSATL